MSESLYITLRFSRLEAQNAKGWLDWAIATVVLDGVDSLSRAVAVQGTEEHPEDAMRSAISMVKNDFVKSGHFNDYRVQPNRTQDEERYGRPTAAYSPTS